jgi:FMN phosphatase YigB (HAD superfamily)
MQILTDFSGVLAGGHTGFAKLVSERSGVPATMIEWFIDKKSPWFSQLFRGRVSEDSFWEMMADGFSEVAKTHGKCALSGEDLKNLYRENIRKPISGTLDVLKRIMYYPVQIGHGGRVGKGTPELWVVTDGIAEMVKPIHSWHPQVFRLIEHEIWSCFHDITKVDPCFFRLLPKMVGSKNASELLVIDNNKRNVDCATIAGIPAIQFVNAEQLENEMTQLGFVFYSKEECASNF